MSESAKSTTQVLVGLDPSGSKSGKEIRGPATLGEIIAGECEQVLDVFMTSEKGNFLAGVWRCTPGTMKLTDYPFNEMATIIEGHIVVTTRTAARSRNLGLATGLQLERVSAGPGTCRSRF